MTAGRSDCESQNQVFKMRDETQTERIYSKTPLTEDRS